ncbi:MAG: hypothetical protein DRP42_00875 [Tenericutes bacterium]|nr:MAG: hypothetical protein DRP42_00875 [Mycoplasmatota bacterium]
MVSESGLFLGRVLDIVVGGQIGGRTVHSLLIEQGHAGLVNPEFANTLLGGLPSLLKVITEIGPFADMVLGMTRTQGLFQLNDLAAYGNLFMPYIYMGITIGTGAYINSKTDQ